MNYSRAIMAMALAGCLLWIPLMDARASQQVQGLPDPIAVKQCIEELGVGARVTVGLKIGRWVRGRIREIHPDRFNLSGSRINSPKTLAYGEVVRLSPSGIDDPFPPDSVCVELEARWPAKTAKPDWKKLKNLSAWNNLGKLQLGKKIEVLQTNLAKHKGRFLFWTEETITLRVKKRELTIPREQVHRVTRLKKSHRIRNGLIGLVAGAAVGALIFESAESEEGAIVAAIIGVPLSIGIGAGVGAAIPPGRPTIYLAARETPKEDQ